MDIKKVKLPKPKNGTQYTFGELVDVLKEAGELDSKRVAKDVYGAFSSLIQSALKKGYVIPLPGLGKILVRESKARLGRNPATGDTIKIPAKKRIRMVVSKSLKESVL